MKRIFTCFIAFTLSIVFSEKSFSQASLELYGETFENTTHTFGLNIPLVGLGLGPNQWIVNGDYDGLGLYQNTMSQDSTFGGTINMAPASNYMHIVNTGSAAQNANYNPAQQSDQFAYMNSVDVCTHGFDNVVFSFFYLCEGTATSYGEVYASIEGGPWTQVGDPFYNNHYKWQYVTISDPSFAGVASVRFGFRWVNASGSDPNPVSLAVDDIRIVGFYDPGNPLVDINVDFVTDTVCQNTALQFHFALTDTVCDGTYEILMSDGSGSFASSTSFGIFNLNYPTTSYPFNFSVPIAGTTPEGNCYRIRVDRISPPPLITGEVSVCFVVIDCPETITTIQPAVTMDTNAVCVGSVIDVPFFSSGVFTSNLYSAQLSDSAGNFPSIPPFTILGTLPSDQQYPFPPGSVSGKIPNVPDGCNYYIRVNSSNPPVFGTPWGPFCITHCDMELNNGQDIRVCLTPTTSGWDTLIEIDINKYDTVMSYLPGNKFSLELRNPNPLPPPTPWGFVNLDSLGFTYAITDTTIHLVVPPLADLLAIPIQPGTYYMRVVASMPEYYDSCFSNVIRLTIGAPSDIPPVATPRAYPSGTPIDSLCGGNLGWFTLNFPHPNQKSTYHWYSSQLNPNRVSVPGSQGGSLLVNFGTGFQGMFSVWVREENFGCLGVDSTLVSLYIKGPPNTTITAPTFACIGDTVLLTTVSQGLWDIAGVGDTILYGDDELMYRWENAGNYTVKFSAQNECGSNTSQKTIRVQSPPEVDINLNDTVVCQGATLMFSTEKGPNYKFYWSEGVDTLYTSASDSTFTIKPDSSTTYMVTVTVRDVCPTTDSVHVDVRQEGVQNLEVLTCPDGNHPLTLDPGIIATTHIWSTGEYSPQIVVVDTGNYKVTIITDTSVCATVFAYHVGPDNCPVPPEQSVNLDVPNIFTPDGNGMNDFFTPLISGPYDQFEIKIYNRWGKLIYGPDNDPFFQWNGKDNQGNTVSAGVYYWIVGASFQGEAYEDQRGFVTLVKD